MFGHVRANLDDLNEEGQKRYQAVYCGLCHAIGKRHGFLSRLTLTYDLTFLTMVLSSLYEPDETCGCCRCVAHPCKKHDYAINPCTEYAADMTIALTYYKCLDDWNDDRNLISWVCAKYLEKKYRKVKQQWPEQCSMIEAELNALARIETASASTADAAANCFGRLMAGLFVYQKDIWEQSLRQLGYGLGRYIYLADAALDYEKDQRTGSYNPLTELSSSPEELKPTLMQVLGEASAAFEFLPLVQDAHILKNILYSGIWIKYNRGVRKKREKNG